VGATNWLFSRSDADTRWWRVIAWWELRRIPFNIIIGAYGIACLAVFFWAITTSGHLSPGEDAVEPMALMAAPFVINILYTLGWVVEIQLRVAYPSLSPQFAPSLDFHVGDSP
jgi:hypothetical protein